MLQYKADHKSVPGGVHAQVLDFPAAITCGHDPAEARRMLAIASVDVAETRPEMGQSLARPDPTVGDPEMDLEEPIDLHMRARSEVCEEPAGVVVP